ncbi:hypothetical protein L195_g003199 [Trifolium pratense]|uniref:Uncharacterized protein n=1 Tax=Trifolium pratense TaxID=57577 RepID=A0A2K3NUM8_TRIPR|nr:hypothetical protein L195_g003199 [Trifolium pratense]
MVKMSLFSSISSTVVTTYQIHHHRESPGFTTIINDKIKTTTADAVTRYDGDSMTICHSISSCSKS